MKKDFSQPFKKLEYATFYFLVETDRNVFLQYTYTDELDAFYATTLGAKFIEAEDFALQLTEVLYENGLALLSYRELLRETRVNFSYLDSTPGTTEDVVVLHVTVERTDQPIPSPTETAVNLISLEEFVANLIATGMPTGILEAGVGYLLVERELLEGV